VKDGKHDCFNRERRDSYLAPVRIYDHSGSSFTIGSKVVPDRSSRECQYSKDVVDAHCAGCKHNRQATEGRQLLPGGQEAKGPQLQAWPLDRPEPPL
jgi:hypothetical protein